MNEELLIEYKRTGNSEVKEKIVLNNLALVKSVCNQLGYTNDLFQEGVILLMSSVDKYEIEKNVAFSTYAYKCIKGGLIDYLTKNVNYNGALSRQESRELTKLKKIQAELSSKIGHGTQLKEFEAENHARIQELENRCYSKSLDANIGHEKNGLTLSDIIPDKHNSEDYQIFKMDMEKLLNEDELKIIDFMSKTKLYIKHIADEFDISERTAYNYVNKLKEKIANYLK
jgi:RNA polymerase sigma factor for flagellar operon FliA